jgi:alpha-mannosidase
VATIEVVSDAPGARSLTRQVRLIDRINRLDITNVIDKLPVREKEGVHFGFPFHVPEAEVRMDTPWAVVRPEKDQMEGACKNFFTVQRWVDVSNLDYGVTVATVDAPLMEMGAIRMDFTSASDFPNSVLRHIETSSTLYSYVVNNYWHTNFKADQEGPTTFRYSIRPHRGLYNQAEAARFGVERNQPLVAIPAWLDGPQPLRPILRIEPDGVVATSLKPSRDKKALLVRLFAVSGKPERVEMSWGRPMRVYLSDAAESRGKAVSGPIELPACGIVLLRAEPGSRLFGWIWPW